MGSEVYPGIFVTGMKGIIKTDAKRKCKSTVQVRVLINVALIFLKNNKVSAGINENLYYRCLRIHVVNPDNLTVTLFPKGHLINGSRESNSRTTRSG